MALTVAGRGASLFAALSCDAWGCECHVALAPADVGVTAYELACATFDLACDEGWWLDGSARCPEHWPEDRPGRRAVVADGYAWVNVTREPVKGAERRSEPLTGGTARPD